MNNNAAGSCNNMAIGARPSGITGSALIANREIHFVTNLIRTEYTDDIIYHI